MHTLLFHQPGHFHAALLLKWSNPRIDRTVHVYASPGPDLDRFVDLVTGFNRRPVDPTDWDLRVHGVKRWAETGPGDSLARLIGERRGELAVVAGRNEPKLATIAQLHRAGFSVLADKPWILGPAGLPDLARITAGPPLAMDIMTGRHDIVNRLSRRIVLTRELFGRFAGGGWEEPDLEFGSVHHLCKIVDGRPLVRPPWYYDVEVQGDGMVDIHSHLVDQAQWLVSGSASEAGARDQDGTGAVAAATPSTMEIARARRWSTEVPLADFTESTGLESFPASLADRIIDPAATSGRGPVLDLACNGLIDYRLAGVSTRQETVWRIRPPAGGADRHSFTARGSRCRLDVSQGPETGYRPELRLTPVDPDRWATGLAEHVESWQREFPGLTAEPIDRGHRLIVPPELATPHESVFKMVLEDFLDRVESGIWSADLAATIRSRYTLLARAHQLASRD